MLAFARSPVTPSLPDPNSCLDRVEQIPRKRETRNSDLCTFGDPGGRNIGTRHSKPQTRGLAMKGSTYSLACRLNCPTALSSSSGFTFTSTMRNRPAPSRNSRSIAPPLTRRGGHRNFLGAKRQPCLQQIRICRKMIGKPVVPLHALASLDTTYRPRFAIEQRLEEVLGLHVPVFKLARK